MKRLFLLAIVFASVSALMAQIQPNFEKIDPDLYEIVDQRPEAWAEVVVALADQVEVNSLAAAFRAKGLTKEQRAPILIRALQEKASSTQGPLLAWLGSHAQAETESIQAFWLGNQIYLRAQGHLIAALSQRADVGMVHRYAQPRLMDAAAPVPAPPLPDDREVGHDAINAPAMWKLGYTGQNVKVLIVDTGTDGTHPALRTNFLGRYLGNNVAWWNQGGNSLAPVDCDGHGTHVAGTAVGLDRDRNDTIGVAYNAWWMAAPAILPQGIGEPCNGVNGPGILSTFQWALNPDGDPNTSDDIPDVVNNSYGQDKPSSCGYFAKSSIDAMEAAGVALVFAAGNDTFPQTIGGPAHLNTSLVNTFAVGSVHPVTLQKSGFSSEGPTVCPGSGPLLIKPEVAAPGAPVRSAYRNGGYAYLGGTSMASPHVAGAIALLKEAFPLLDGEQLKLALYYSAVDLGAPGEDNVYGRGIIDVKAAYDYLVAQNHSPFQPPVERDAGLALVTDADLCGLSIAPEVELINRGSGAISSVKVRATYSDGTVLDTLWTGNLATGATQLVKLPLHQFAGPGNYDVELEIVEENGLDPYYIFDNFDRMTVTALEGVAATTISANACIGRSVLLQASVDDSLATGVWYDQPTGGTALATGLAFVTPALTSSKIFYFSPQKRAHLGAELLVGTPGLNNPNTIDYLEFDANFPFTLQRVTVLSAGSGSRVIELRNAQGQVIASRTVTVVPGEQVLDLNLPVPAGEDLQLGLGGNQAMLFTSYSNYSFPYEVPGVLTITGSNNGFYNFFFDWQISWELPCDRIMAFATVSPGSQTANIAGDTLARVGQPIGFIAVAPNASQYLWDFGDGTTSTDQNPTHVFQAAGNYDVSLMATGPTFCSDATTQTVLVQDDTATSLEAQEAITSLQIFPNPSEGLFDIQLYLNRDQEVSASLINAAGQTVAVLPRARTNLWFYQLDISGLPDGMYMLKLQAGDQVATRRILKLQP